MIKTLWFVGHACSTCRDGEHQHETQGLNARETPAAAAHQHDRSDARGNARGGRDHPRPCSATAAPGATELTPQVGHGFVSTTTMRDSEGASYFFAINRARPRGRKDGSGPRGHIGGHIGTATGFWPLHTTCRSISPGNKGGILSLHQSSPVVRRCSARDVASHRVLPVTRRAPSHLESHHQHDRFHHTLTTPTTPQQPQPFPLPSYQFPAYHPTYRPRNTAARIHHPKALFDMSTRQPPPLRAFVTLPRPRCSNRQPQP